MATEPQLSRDGVEDLTKKFLHKRFFLVKTRPVAPLAEVQKYLRAHLLNQIKLEKEGILFAAGPVSDMDGNFQYGMFILRCETEAEARRIADEDPMHKAGVRKYELNRWMMNEGRVNISIDASDGTYHFA